MWSVLRGLALAVSLVEPVPVRQESVLIRLWEDPRPIATRDLFWGAGSADRAPRPRSRSSKIRPAARSRR